MGNDVTGFRTKKRSFTLAGFPIGELRTWGPRMAVAQGNVLEAGVVCGD